MPQTADHPKIRDHLAEWYRELHAQGKFLGKSFAAHLPAAEALFGPVAAMTRVLDFGCGPQGGLATVAPGVVRPYDPYVPEFAADPWPHGPYDLVFSSDVLEHLTVPEVHHFLGRVVKTRPGGLFLAVSTRAANKAFPNGVNVHLTVEPVDWWRGFCQARLGGYRLALCRDDRVTDTAVFGYVREDAR